VPDRSGSAALCGPLLCKRARPFGSRPSSRSPLVGDEAGLAGRKPKPPEGDGEHESCDDSELSAAVT